MSDQTRLDDEKLVRMHRYRWISTTCCGAQGGRHRHSIGRRLPDPDLKCSTIAAWRSPTIASRQGQHVGRFPETIPVPCTNLCAGGSSACPTRVCPISLSITGLKVTSFGEDTLLPASGRSIRAASTSMPGVQILDARGPGEFDGPLGHIRGVPLGELARRASGLARASDRRNVPRRSRSAHATVILRESGFGDVANLAGGGAEAVEGGSSLGLRRRIYDMTPVLKAVSSIRSPPAGHRG